MTPKRAGSPSITDAPTPSRALRSAISLKLSTSRRKTTSYEKPCAACGSDAVSGSTGTRACGVCGSVHRDYELRDREPRGRHAARDDVGGSVQRHGVGGERLRQGRPLVVHALRIPQQILHGLRARRLERRGVPRAGRAADDGHDGPSDGGLPGVRHVVQGRKGLPGLLLGLSGQVRRPCRSHGHGA